MEIQVKVSKILESTSYVSKKDGMTYVKHYFLGVTGGDYPKTICFSCLGDDKYNSLGIELGVDYLISFDVNSREWNGKWFTDVVCWKASRV